MADQTRTRELGIALAAELDERAAAERYDRRQREVRRSGDSGAERPHTLKLETGNPAIPKRGLGFLKHVARRLAPR